MTDRATQQQIIEELEVVQDFDAERETERRIGFLAGYLAKTGLKGYVLGISGGVDSSTAGRLAQLACERARENGHDARFIAIRLPYRVQKDEDDAQRALQFIQPDESTTVNIGPATDAMWDEVMSSDSTPDETSLTDFVKGNVKARERMIAQYTVAGARGMLVIGTDQAAEAVVGFYTKYGDGAADVLPLAGLPKRRVREIATYLGAHDDIVSKVPTADLESDKPMLPDEQALGVAYHDVDDYLEGKEVSPEAEQTIVGWYRRTAHKRALPLTPAGFEQSAE
ncbi:ammonia-dependent NAD(+) synthetase [Cumulibacter manganitolerans]|uniref:ammonia-dependent NAD(+) synthetase n=1 Tax=Cumulibacter manganitolerans TaxID=1884992 RepID=UPI00129613E1|nr:ammonia-dependent NAD(+) synthetase [Cumulibacter manganitolerans]